MIQLADYVTALPGVDWTKPNPNLGPTLYDYIFAGNGVFKRAKRDGLEICIPIADCEIRGLTTIEPAVNLAYPRVPGNYLSKMLEISQTKCIENGTPLEVLFHLRWGEDTQRWRLDKPRQTATSISVRPIDDDAESSYGQALIELHSHHGMDAFFSGPADQPGTDDADEQGFRIYAVLGNIFKKPELRVRVGCYGDFYELPASQIFELPEEIAESDPEN